MAKYVTKRIMYMIFVLIIMSFIMFMLYNAIPGDPARAELEGQKQQLTAEQYEARYQALRKQMGLDDPTIVKYGKWVGGILQGDLGYSNVYKTDVKNIIATPLKNTIFINVFSVFFALLITIPLGIYCAVHKRTKFDSAVQVLTIVGYSLPTFIISLIAIFLFAVKLGWFPVSGTSTPNFQGTGWEKFLDRLYYMCLPLIVMTIGALGGMTRYVRAAMIEALGQDYIRTARAKGLKERVVIYSHAWRNALLPVITMIIGWFLSIFGGSLVIEQMFGLNGMGKLMYASLVNQDYEVVLAMQMFYMIISLLGNLICDLSYGIVDPRVRINQ
ncbi:MAG: ABC transporter permease [Lachnospiraceae bacterium]|nr:ABC transporter permease [Lachnospiraceae bacterium]